MENDEECKVFGCKNRKSQGRFVGNICCPCYDMITSGDASKMSKNFIKKLYDENQRLRKQFK